MELTLRRVRGEVAVTPLRPASGERRRLLAIRGRRAPHRGLLQPRHRHRRIEDLIDYYVTRVPDQFRMKIDAARRWGSGAEQSEGC